MSFVVFDCRGCGAGIAVQPDNLLTVCSRCGSIYPAKELGDVPIHIVASAPEEAVRAAVKARMAQDSHMKRVRIHINEARGLYVPLYVQRVLAEGTWEGYRIEKQGKSSVRVSRSGRFRHEGDYPVFARQHAHEFGMAGLGQVFSALKPVPFREIAWPSAALPVLSVDIGEPQADRMVQDSILDRIGEGVKTKDSLDAITAFDATVEIRDRFILLVPLWTVTYLWRGGSYRVAVCGAGAAPVVLAAMEPVFLARRLWHLGLGLSGVLGAGVLGYAAFWMLLLSDSEEGGKVAAGVGFLVLGCIWLAWRTGGKLVASVNIEHMGRSEEVLS